VDSNARTFHFFNGRSSKLCCVCHQKNAERKLQDRWKCPYCTQHQAGRKRCRPYLCRGFANLSQGTLGIREWRHSKTWVRTQACASCSRKHRWRRAAMLSNSKESPAFRFLRNAVKEKLTFPRKIHPPLLHSFQTRFSQRHRFRCCHQRRVVFGQGRQVDVLVVRHLLLPAAIDNTNPFKG